MTDRELEKRIKDSFEQIKPDVLASVLADCEEKGQVLEMKESVINKRPEKLRRFASIAAVFIILMASVIGVNAYQMNQAVSARVSLDVNPSVEIQVNKKERVLDVIALNEDGKTIIGDMDFSGSDIDVAVNALVGSMMRNGFISDMANSILVTVSGKDAVKDAALQTRIADEIDKILAGNAVNGAILSQVLVEDKDLDDLAKEYGITAGKAKLIKEITAKNDIYKIEDLVPLTINELNLLTLSNEIKFETIQAHGKASDTAYVGNEEAEKTALAHAGVSADKAELLRSKLDWEHGKMVYEVEFKSEGYEYDYEVDAITGAVVDFEKEVDDDYRPTTAASTNTSTNSNANAGSNANVGGNPNTGGNAGGGTASTQTTQTIGVEAAKAKALEHAGLSEGQVTELEIDYDAEEAKYEVGFKHGGYEYDYDIDIYTGSIIKVDKEADDDYRPTGNGGSAPTASAPAQTQPQASAPTQASAPSGSGGTSTSVGTPAQSAVPAQQVIGAAAAQNAALSHAGFSASQVSALEVDYDAEDGDYDISFKAGGYEYDYEINAYTGSVLKSEKEIDD